MFTRRAGLVLAAAGIAAATLGGCGSSPTVLIPHVPDNVAAVRQSLPAASALTVLGYNPAYVLQGNDSYAWATCPTTTAAELTACSKALNFQGTGDTPNVFVLDGRVAYLEGVKQDDLNNATLVVWITIPNTPEWSFSSLTVAQQKQILGLASIAESEIGDANTMSLELTINGRQYPFIARAGFDWPPDVSPGS